MSPLQGTPYDASGGLVPHERHMLAHAGRRSQDSTVRRGRHSVPALDLAIPPGNPTISRYVIAGSQAFFDAETFWTVL